MLLRKPVSLKASFLWIPIVFAALALGLAAPSEALCLKLGGVDVPDPRCERYGLDLAAGIAGVDGFDDGRGAFLVAPRFELWSSAAGTLDFTVPVMRLSGRVPAPLAPLCDDPGAPCNFQEILFLLGEDDLEIGPSWAVAPSLEWTWCDAGCLQPSIFFGLGVRFDRGQTTEVPDLGPYTTDDVTSPIATYGFALRLPVTERVALRFEARAITTFYDDIQLTAFNGARPTLEAETVTSGIVSLGIHWSF